MKSKKGAEMTVGTIIIIVLALIVLVVLVVGFTGGWSNLWGRITNFFGGGSNVDSVVQACQVACTTNQKYEYCDRMRDVKFEDKTENGKYNCEFLPNLGVSLEACANIECPEKNCGDLGGMWIDKDCKKQDLTPMVTNATEKTGQSLLGNVICCAK